MVFLCGQLDLVVVEAEHLTNLDSNILNPDDKSDPYCVVDLHTGGSFVRIGKTYTINDNLNPKWYYKVSHEINQEVDGIRFTVKDKDLVSSETIGTCYLPVQAFDEGYDLLPTLPLENHKGRFAGTLTLSVRFHKRESSTVTIQERAWTKAGELKSRVSRTLPKFKYSGDSSDSKSSLGEMAYLHGVIEIAVERAKELPNLDSSILSLNKKDVSDPYCVVTLEDTEGEPWKVATTSVIDNNLNPFWDETFRVDVCHEVSSITFMVRDKDFLSSEMIGSRTFPADVLLGGNGISGTFDLYRDSKGKKAGQITIDVKFYTKHLISLSPEVPECLFPLRENNRVSLYQDAHCPTLPVPALAPDGSQYYPQSLWRDIYHTITGAKKFIYIVGWSVSTKIALLRNDGEDSRPLGELLRQKSFEGVRVLLLLWDELTSNDLKKHGTMSTEDEETMNFFKGTPVTVILAPRNRHSKDMFSTKMHFTMLCYTHHQKCVIADEPIEEFPNKRKVVAYVGGLDLTGGRYDNPNHDLFRTLTKEHLNDFRNRMLPGITSAIGPREPWHDIHSRVEGPAALDVYKNFEERWKKQATDNIPSLLYLPHVEDLLLDYGVATPDRWSVQMFRSINTDSAVFDQQCGKHLKQKKGRAFDNSLHRAYIHQIRRAQHFIYIENQYFMGSSHMWKDCRDAKAGNLIPLEIAAKICEKIHSGERFSAYIVIPMFPEGKPSDKVTQEILHWQHRTMEMMYARIAKALEDVGSSAHPLEYLMFFCLGRRETEDMVPQELLLPKPDDQYAVNARNNRRLMIYVHSKMAIFDDEYIIIGSANINDRSMSGNRDTEIAVGCFQPYFMVGNSEALPLGTVAMFRRSLWAEHLAHLSPAFHDPSSIECMQEVRALAEEAWLAFMADEHCRTPRHLLMYPVVVHSDGTVHARADCPNFPDTNASIVGARSKVFPRSLTT